MARKILLADDSVTAQNMGRRILSDAGYEVTTVNNGAAALKKIAESKPDLIVLDVYMPGYGGLEVCQRLRESRETARIPVLLTVGKLEPFKPEEVRRVRADAFVVKPFEASELLTALTKLEDRIVPQPQPHKPGRFAKAIEAIEVGDISNEYGDLDSGWKNRLKIPVPKSHGKEVEEEQVERFEGPKPEPPKPSAPEPSAGLPRDITPEEIAAINAAAAAFGTKIEPPASEPEVKAEPVAKIEEVKPASEIGEEIGATFASAAIAEESASAVEEKIEPAPEEVKAEAEAAPAVQEAQPETDPPAPAVEEVTAVTAEAVNAEPVKEERDDFAAALESLAPANGNGSGGPRWIAESATLSSEEAALILEQEMQKAVAAMALVSEAATDSAEPRAQETPVEVMQESHDTGTADQATSLVAAMMGEAPLPAEQPPAPPESPETQGTAFAAAASAGTDAVSQTSLSVETPQSEAPASSEEDRQREAELAAAWESWKHIRESIAGPQNKGEAAVPAETAAEPAPAEYVEAEGPESEAEAANPEEAVASIVDSVLADLKPKLMAEISKKMSKEKKRR